MPGAPGFMTAPVCWFLMINVGVGWPPPPPGWCCWPGCDAPPNCCCWCWCWSVAFTPPMLAVWISCGCCWVTESVPLGSEDGVSVTRLLFMLSTAVCGTPPAAGYTSFTGSFFGIFDDVRMWLLLLPSMMLLLLLLLLLLCADLPIGRADRRLTLADWRLKPVVESNATAKSIDSLLHSTDNRGDDDDANRKVDEINHDYDEERDTATTTTTTTKNKLAEQKRHHRLLQLTICLDMHYSLGSTLPSGEGVIIAQVIKRRRQSPPLLGRECIFQGRREPETFLLARQKRPSLINIPWAPLLC
uniref:Uncharacterized protein n=1 Tax=Anopheles atroparvus TaxID=41427 RepID=A0A182JLG2_ANOAO